MSLDPTLGHEIRVPRPVLCCRPMPSTKASGLLLVAPITQGGNGSRRRLQRDVDGFRHADAERGAVRPDAHRRCACAHASGSKGAAEIWSQSAGRGTRDRTRMTRLESSMAAKPAPAARVADLSAAGWNADHHLSRPRRSGHHRRRVRPPAARARSASNRASELADADSPTRRVGATPSGAFSEVVHAMLMLSLANAFSDGEVADFVARIGKETGDESPAFSTEQARQAGDQPALRARRSCAARPAATARLART